MKNIKQIVVLALGLSAASAYASGYALDVTSPNDTIATAVVVGNLGQNGVTTTFNVTVDANKNPGYFLSSATQVAVYAVDNSGNDIGSPLTLGADPFTVTGITGIADGTSLTQGITGQNLTVTFNIANNNAFIGHLYGIELIAGYSATSGGPLAGSGSDTAIVAVPEPAQTIAGGMLLGIGGLVFAGRRLMGKKTA